MFITVSYLYLILMVVNSSKCPEFRRPHDTNCAMFYNCINLPVDGFIWVPLKCNDNLVFQPYLKKCVLPSETWSCDRLKNKSLSTTTNYKNPNFVKIVDHQNYTQADSNKSETSDLLNKSTVHLHPFIKIENTIIYKNNNKYNNKHIMNPVTIDQKKENYIYKYINKRYQIKLPFTSKNKDHLQNHIQNWINQLIHHLTVYKELLLSLNQLIFHNQLVEPLESVENNKNILNILLKYNIQQSKYKINYYNIVKNTITFPNFFDIEKYKTNGSNINSPVRNIIEKCNKTKDKGDNNANTDNSLLIITDDFGNKEYITIEKYKSIAYKIKPNSIHLIPCIKEIRFANRSDCMKYYTCEPLLARIKEFSCPDNTAFNEYTRICDTYTYKICKGHKSIFTELSTINNIKINNSMSNNGISKEKICQEIGKAEDPISETYYYICYSSTKKSGEIKAVRMKCPNNLKFCKSKKVCTTKQRCIN